MEVIPAVDLYSGQVVRLESGKLERKTAYRTQPEEAARRFEEQGATWVHVVDLNGAFSGQPQNLDAFVAVRNAVSCKLQVGGGIRTMDAAQRWFDLGADRIVLSTLLAEDPTLACRIAAAFPGRVLASLDLVDGRLAVRGWNRTAPLPDLDGLKASGFAGLVFTDTRRDGTLSGQDGTFLPPPESGLPFFVAGGVRDLDDVRALKSKGAAGVILGKALYENRIDLVAALEVARC